MCNILSLIKIRNSCKCCTKVQKVQKVL